MCSDADFTLTTDRLVFSTIQFLHKTPLKTTKCHFYIPVKELI